MNDYSTSPRRWGYVYAIECGGRVKIGRAVDVDLRLRQFAVQQFPYPLMLIRAVPVPDPVRVERFIHRVFAGFRVHGEWFDFSGAPDWLDAFDLWIEEARAA